MFVARPKIDYPMKSSIPYWQKNMNPETKTSGRVFPEVKNPVTDWMVNKSQKPAEPQNLIKRIENPPPDIKQVFEIKPKPTPLPKIYDKEQDPVKWFQKQTNELRDRRWKKWVQQDIYQRELAYWQDRAARINQEDYSLLSSDDYAGYLTNRKTIDDYNGLQATREANQKTQDQVNQTYSEKLTDIQNTYGLNGQDPMTQFLQTYFPNEGYILHLPEFGQVNGLYETLSEEEKLQYAQMYNEALTFEQELAANPQYQADLNELQALQGRLEVIGQGISGNDYQLTQQQEAYETAMAQNEELLAIIIEMEEEEPGSGKALAQQLDGIYSYGGYEAPLREGKSTWQAMAEKGMAQDVLQENLTSFCVNQEGQLTRVRELIAFGEENDLPSEYLENLYRAEKVLKEQIDQAKDFNLRYNSDFQSVVADYKTQNSIVTAMSTEPQPLKGEGEHTKHLWEDERDTYYYLKATQGDEAAKAYLKRLEPMLNYRASEALAKQSGEFAEGQPVAATALSIVASPAKVAGVFYSLGCWITGEEIDPYHPAFNPNVFVESTQGEVKRQIDAIFPEGTFGNLLANLGYGVLTDGAETMLGVALMGPTGTAVVQGMGQASDTLRNVKIRGGSDDQALLRAGASLLTNALTEKLPLDSLSRILRGKDVAGLRKLIGNSLSGGTKEGISTLISGSLERLSDEQIMGALSQRSQLIKQMKGEEAYKDLSPAELEAKADELILQQLMYECATATASGIATHATGTLMAGLDKWEESRQQPVESFGEDEPEIWANKKAPKDLTHSAEPENNESTNIVESIWYYDVEKWGEELRGVAQQKVEYENNDSRKTMVTQRPKSMRRKFMKQHGLKTIPPGMDVDHMKSLRNGGSNDMENLWLLDSRINRSFGAQMMNSMKGYPEGTQFKFVLKDKEQAK